MVVSIQVNAQSKFGQDSIGCITNISLYQDSYKTKNYSDAFEAWRWVFLNCPASSQNIYKHGPVILKQRIKDQPESKTEYIDTLMMLYDQRIKYFGNEGFVLGRKGSDYRKYYRKDYESSYQILAKSIELQSEKSEANAVLNYFRSCFDMHKNSKISDLDLVNAYVNSLKIIERNLVNISAKLETEDNPKKIKLYSNRKSGYDQALEKVVKLYSCEDCCSDLTAIYNLESQDLDMLKRIANVLSNNNCTNSDLYFTTATSLYEKEPSASSASEMGKMNVAREDYSQAIDYFNQAISLEIDVNKKAKYYLELADGLRISGSYSKARQAVYSSLDLREGWGEAYMLLGNIYVASASSCGSEFEQSTVFWVAVDAFISALKDPETKERASKNINTYSRYFPSTDDCFFNADVTSGQTYTVGCWINKSTKVRTID